jgi:hypothetical protein
VAEQLKFRPGPAEDIEELLFINFRHFADPETEVIEQVLCNKNWRPSRFGQDSTSIRGNVGKSRVDAQQLERV